ncbi:DegT/DnrJ/EryC1/StrS family aminotransferase [Bradyrhizobium sp. CB1717]|uniref:DegT/DnrJ/EryC1/StrS family aminotransferase n=1 Tax=Bradyrhizobium sp. CB1717 TaxID=3039154 RepID=UPI0024B1B9E9|nr:DegT/DnrJ/EryC1/StrS family aminotransferase [Bradyrhizobium sp. CB1717]WFU25477.1 DegT/DnrJ/EryC1/StrS family aminotransferase [Bradyrhizobium sp. CB1717]
MVANHMRFRQGRRIFDIEIGEYDMIVSRYNYTSQFGDQLPVTVAAIQEALLNGDYILGNHVESFETSFASLIGANYCVGVNSGTDALILGLSACGLGQGSRIAVPASTFHATILAVVRIGAIPILIDADPRTFLMDLDSLEGERHLDAILPVHLFGLAADMEKIRLHANRIGAIVIEDCAQAHGAMDGSRRTGALGAVGCYSFHPSKNLAAAGDAGACVTNDAEIAERLRWLRQLGQKAQNDHLVAGFNSRLDVIQAIVLSVKLPKLEQWNQARAAIAARYRSELGIYPVSFQDPRGPGEHVYHLFQMRTRDRDALLKHLRALGVDATIRYPVPVHQQPAFRQEPWAQGRFPVAEALAKELLCLPIRPDLTDEEITHVLRSVGEFF